MVEDPTAVKHVKGSVVRVVNNEPLAHLKIDYIYVNYASGWFVSSDTLSMGSVTTDENGNFELILENTINPRLYYTIKNEHYETFDKEFLFKSDSLIIGMYKLKPFLVDIENVNAFDESDILSIGIEKGLLYKVQFEDSIEINYPKYIFGYSEYNGINIKARLYYIVNEYVHNRLNIMYNIVRNGERKSFNTDLIPFDINADTLYYKLEY